MLTSSISFVPVAMLIGAFAAVIGLACVLIWIDTGPRSFPRETRYNPEAETLVPRPDGPAVAPAMTGDAVTILMLSEYSTGDDVADWVVRNNLVTAAGRALELVYRLHPGGTFHVYVDHELCALVFNVRVTEPTYDRHEVEVVPLL